MFNKRQKLGKYIMQVIAIALTIALTLPTFSENAEAAKAPELTITKTANIYVGKKLNINVNNKIKGAKYSWSTSNNKVAAVNNKGIVTGIKAGTATITCKVTATDKTYTLTGTVKVIQGVTSIEISNKKEAKKLVIGDTFTLETETDNEGAADKITFTSADTSIVKVNQKGKLTAVKVGKAKITAKTASGKKASVTVNVKDVITVATQKELTAALAKKNLSRITIKTNNAATFTIKAGNTYNSTLLVVNAPNADVINEGSTFKNIRIAAIKATTFTEKGKGNNFNLKAPNARLVISEGAEVKNISLRGAKADIIVDGTISGAVTYIAGTAAAPEVTLSGKTTSAVKIINNRVGAKLITSIKAAVQLNVSAELTFEKGSEGSTVSKKNNSVDAKLNNNTDAEIEITVGETTPETKPETPETLTPGGSTTTPSDKTETIKSSTTGATATYTLPADIDKLSSAKVKVGGTVNKDYPISKEVLTYITGLLDKESTYITLWEKTNTFSTTQGGITVSFEGQGNTKTVTFEGEKYEVEVKKDTNEVKVKKDEGTASYTLTKQGSRTLTITSDINNDTASLVSFEVTYKQ